MPLRRAQAMAEEWVGAQRPREIIAKGLVRTPPLRHGRSSDERAPLNAISDCSGRFQP
jgi:hypothetical protein